MPKVETKGVLRVTRAAAAPSMAHMQIPGAPLHKNLTIINIVGEGLFHNDAQQLCCLSAKVGDLNGELN